MPAVAAAGLADDAARLRGGEAQVAGAVGHLGVRAQAALAVAHGLGNDARHARVALDAVGLDRVPGAEGGAGHEIGEHRLLDPGLAERRQDALDVPEEHAVGPDDENPLVLERETMRIEEVCGAVQGDHGLARAGAALDHEDAGLRRADDLVLLGLDGGDDVAELAGTAAGEDGEEGAVAAQAADALEPLVVPDAEVARAEELVLDAEELAPVDREVAPAGEAHRVAARRSVEGLGDGRAPVDDDGLGGLVGHRDAADVERLDGHVGRRGAVGANAGHGRAIAVRDAVDAAEDQRGVAEVQLREAREQRLVEGVALEARLEGAARRGLGELADPPGVVAEALEARVGVVDVPLLRVEFGVLGHRSAWPRVGPTAHLGVYGVSQLYRRPVRAVPAVPWPRRRALTGV